MQVCVVGVEGGEPWGFFNLHFSNSFLLCSPKRQHAEWSKHLTFVKCWWSGPDRRGSVRWRVGGSSKQEFKFHLFHFSVHKLEEVRRGRRQNRGSFQLRVTATTSLATSCQERHSRHLSAKNILPGGVQSGEAPGDPGPRQPGRGWSQEPKAVELRHREVTKWLGLRPGHCHPCNVCSHWLRPHCLPVKVFSRYLSEPEVRYAAPARVEFSCPGRSSVPRQGSNLGTCVCPLHLTAPPPP